MNISERIDSFSELGRILENSLGSGRGSMETGFRELIGRQQYLNPWFTPDNVTYAVKAIARQLTRENLERWVSAYKDINAINRPITAAIIMAGNIPLAGFHDFMSVLISGNRLLAKTSSKDSELIVKIGEILCSINNAFTGRIDFTEGTLTDFDIVIATGSNNSSRYFEYYFSRYPCIIRRNRNSVAILDGQETGAELENLGKDIFLYFGLGCRSVSKLYLPEGYDMEQLLERLEPCAAVINHTKYANNYDFRKAVYLVNREKFLDTGYLLLREDNALSSPVAVLHYEFYKSEEDLRQNLHSMKENIQCIAGHHHLPFGETQSPHLWDYADQVDTLEFILKKSRAGIL